MYVHAISSQRWCCQIKQSVYVHVICSKLVLSDKAVCVCARYLLQVGCQIKQSVYVHVICSKLAVR